MNFTKLALLAALSVATVNAGHQDENKICAQYVKAAEPDGEVISNEVPRVDKCTLKRTKFLLNYEPNFPADRPDVYIEVEIGDGTRYSFFPNDFVDWDAAKYAEMGYDYKEVKGGGTVPMVDRDVHQILYDEQEKLGGQGFKFRFVGDRGPGEWNSCKYSPIAFDINGSGMIETISQDDAGFEAGFEIDISGDGEKEHLAQWFAPQAGILIDVKGKKEKKELLEHGIITGEHMMGDMAGEYTDGFAKLATYDEDCDNKLSGDELDDLYIWVDKNSNTLLDKGELKRLRDYDIKELSTVHSDLMSHAVLKDGSQMLMQDLWFDPYEVPVTPPGALPKSALPPPKEVTRNREAVPDFMPRDGEIAGECGHSCGCFTCGDVVDNGDGTIDVTVNHCKAGSISWMCCTGVDDQEGNCDVTAPCNGPKCEGIAQGGGLTVRLPDDATTFNINTHDGQTAGTGNMNPVCGGSGKNQGGKCADADGGMTAHCEITFDIEKQCGVAPKPEPEPEPPVKTIGVCESVESLEFETDGEGKATSAGDLAENLWDNLGISITTSDPNKPAMLFDTANPTGGDTDLASDTEGMVLIISEDGDSNDPDDNAKGGTITIDFDSPVCYESMGVFDMEDQTIIKMYDQAGNLLGGERKAPIMKDAEARTMALDTCGVYKMEVIMVGSGAVTGLQYCMDPSEEPKSPSLVEICVENPDHKYEFTMQNILESTVKDDMRPGDEITIDGAVYTLSDTCSVKKPVPEPEFMVCREHLGTYKMTKITKGDIKDTDMFPGDTTNCKGLESTLSETCICTPKSPEEPEPEVGVCRATGLDVPYVMVQIAKAADKKGTDLVPGDKITIDGAVYTLTDVCALERDEPEKEVEVCRSSGDGTDSYVMVQIAESAVDKGTELFPGDKITIDGAEYTLTDVCALERDATPAPTESTPAPTESPKTPPPKIPAPTGQPKSGPTDPPAKGSGSGDPHFKTWTGDKYDYHGECDLVLVNNPEFNNGQGLRVHIRTTRIKYFSFIEKIAIQIGKDVLEFDNDVKNFLINGKAVPESTKHHKTMLGGFVVRRDPRALSIRMNDRGSDKTHKNAKIDLHTRKNGFPAVIVDAGHVNDIFKGSLGLLGEYGTGRKLARDGKTEIPMDSHDATAFALEWQVRNDEPQLFKDARFPQFPAKCTPPAPMPARLGTSLMKKEAEEACSHWEEDMDDCIFDVMATRDVLVAEEGHIVHIE